MVLKPPKTQTWLVRPRVGARGRGRGRGRIRIRVWVEAAEDADVRVDETEG
jgi:hypothetical protein